MSYIGSGSREISDHSFFWMSNVVIFDCKSTSALDDHAIWRHDSLSSNISGHRNYDWLIMITINYVLKKCYDQFKYYNVQWCGKYNNYITMQLGWLKFLGTRLSVMTASAKSWHPTTIYEHSRFRYGDVLMEASMTSPRLSEKRSRGESRKWIYKP